MTREGLIAVRCLLVAAVEGAAGLGLWALTRPALAQVRAQALRGSAPGADWTLEQVVVGSSSCLACAVFIALVASTALTVVQALRRPRRRSRAAAAVGLRAVGSPLWWRRAVLSACGLGLAAPGPAGPAVAMGDHAHDPCGAQCAAVSSAESLLAGLRLPDLPEVPLAAKASVEPVIVQPGDSLWTIARAELPQAATDSAICRRVDALYAANRTVIGADPDLILPGMRLTNPGGM